MSPQFQNFLSGVVSAEVSENQRRLPAASLLGLRQVDLRSVVPGLEGGLSVWYIIGPQEMNITIFLGALDNCFSPSFCNQN